MQLLWQEISSHISISILSGQSFSKLRGNKVGLMNTAHLVTLLFNSSRLNSYGCDSLYTVLVIMLGITEEQCVSGHSKWVCVSRSKFVIIRTKYILRMSPVCYQALISVYLDKSVGTSIIISVWTGICAVLQRMYKSDPIQMECKRGISGFVF